MEPGPGRKRRKWDVAAPEGVPANQGMAPAGTPAFGFASPALSNHFIPQGLNPAFALQQPAQPKPLLDVKGLKPGQPLDASLIAKAQAAAAAAVANINKDLVKKGLVAPGRGGVEEEKKEFYRDVTINDAPPPIRHHLTKRSTQDDIARRTGTVLTVKGRYYSPGEPEDEAEKPLFLRVTPGLCLQDGEAAAQRQVNEAAAEIQRLLQGHGSMRPPGGPSYAPGQGGPRPQSNGMNYNMPAGGPGGPGPTGPQGPAGPYAQAPTHVVPPNSQSAIVIPLYINLEPAPGFDVAQKVRGPGDSYLTHIGKESGASVILRGRGSGMQETLATHLIDTVRNEYAKMFPYGPPAAAPPPQGPAGYTGSGGYPARPGAPPPASYGGPPPSMPPGQYPPAGGGPPFVNPPPGAGYPPPGSYMHFGPQGAAPPAPYAYPAYGAGPPRGPTQYPGYGGPPPPGGPAPSMYGPPSGQQPGPYGAYQAGAPRQGAHAQTVQYPQHQQQGPPQQGAPPPSQQAGRAPQSQQGEAGPEQRRRRFSEYKDGSSSAPQATGASRFTHASDGQPQQAVHQGPGSMGPPPPMRSQMGPPPPRRPMGPPPPQGGPATSNAGRVVGSLMGLVDYGDAD